MGVAEHDGVRSTFSKPSGKWYWEVTIDSGTTHYIGVATKDASLSNNALGTDEHGWGYCDDGKIYYNNTPLTFGDMFVVGDVIGIALDMGSGFLWFAKNGVWQDSGDPADGTNEAYSGITGEIFAMWSGYDSGEVTANFGDSAFAYPSPVGFRSLSSSRSTEKWDEDEKGSNVALTDNNLTAYGSSLQPDFNLHEGTVITTRGVKTGKWYFEIVASAMDSTYLPRTHHRIGIATSAVALENALGDDSNGYGIDSYSGYLWHNGAQTDYMSTVGYGDIIGVALDLTNDKIWFSRNGSWLNSGVPTTGENPAISGISHAEWFPSCTVTHQWAYSNSELVQVVTKGLLRCNENDITYTPPTGFLPLNDPSTIYEGSLAEGTNLSDANEVIVSYGGETADFFGTISENLTTEDFIFGTLPGDSEETHLHSADSFTTNDSISVETPYQDLNEDVTLSASILVDSPYRSNSENTILSDDISVAYDPANVTITENVTTSDEIGVPIYAEIAEGLSTADSMSRGGESLMFSAEHATFADSMSAYKDDTIKVTESIGFYDTPSPGWGLTFSDALGLADALTLESGLRLLEQLMLFDTTDTNWEGTETVLSSLQVYGSLIAGEIFNEVAISSIAMVDVVSVLGDMISAIAESLGLADSVANRAEFNPVIAEALAITGAVTVTKALYAQNTESIDFEDSARVGWGIEVSDTIGLVDTVDRLWYCMNILTESLEFTETVLNQFQIDEKISDVLEFASTIAVQKVLTSKVKDVIDFGVTIELNGELWECWVLGTDQFNVSVYSNFDFNSYAVYGGAAYGCRPDGVYELAGDDDDGDAIVPGVVLPDSYYGDSRRKRFRRAIFGLSGGTTPSLKVETDSGEKVYTITDSQANVTRDMVGKKWTLKVQDFDSLDFIELVPVILARKKKD
ncbi:MAG TPA: hypothetical protein ENH07_10435 [Nitrospirae bacterium]|nr:hypothetical protein [Nitrospirota bacterium]